MIKQLEKQLKNWQNRSSAVRQQSDVIQDRERISKVHVISSPKKQVDKEKSPPKNEGNKETGFTDFIKNLFSKNNV